MVVTPVAEMFVTRSPATVTVCASMQESGVSVVCVSRLADLSRRLRVRVSFPCISTVTTSEYKPSMSPSPVRRVRESPVRITAAEPFCRVCHDDVSRHQSPSSFTYETSFDVTISFEVSNNAFKSRSLTVKTLSPK